MAGNYKGSTPQYIDDFIYTPPFKLMQEALANKDKIVDDAVDNIDLLQSLNFKYWEDVDKERANALKEEYSKGAEDIYNILKDNLEDPKVFSMIRLMRKKLKQDYAPDGRITKLEENAKRWEEWKKKLDSKKLSDEEKKGYLRAVEVYKKEHPEGAYSGLFEGPDVYETWDAVSDYIKSDAFKRLHPDVRKSIRDVDDLIHIITNASTVKELSLRNKIIPSFKGWLRDNPKLKGYASSRSTWLGEKFYNDKGELDFTDKDAVPRKWLERLAPYAYKEQGYEHRLRSSPYAAMTLANRKNNGGDGDIEEVNIKDYYLKTPAGLKTLKMFMTNTSSLVAGMGAYLKDIANNTTDSTKRKALMQIANLMSTINGPYVIDTSVLKDLNSSDHNKAKKAKEYLRQVNAKYSMLSKIITAIGSNKKFYDTYIKNNKALNDMYGKIVNAYNRFNMSMSAGTGEFYKIPGADPEKIQKAIRDDIKNNTNKAMMYVAVPTGNEDSIGNEEFLSMPYDNEASVVTVNDIPDIIKSNLDKFNIDANPDDVNVKIKSVGDAKPVKSAYGKYDDSGDIKYRTGYVVPITVVVSWGGGSVDGITEGKHSKEIVLSAYSTGKNIQSKHYNK